MEISWEMVQVRAKKNIKTIPQNTSARILSLSLLLAFKICKQTAQKGDSTHKIGNVEELQVSLKYANSALAFERGLAASNKKPPEARDDEMLGGDVISPIGFRWLFLCGYSAPNLK